MSFDKNSDKPPVNFHKWTTKVNLWMIGGVVLFLAIGFAAIFWVKK